MPTECTAPSAAAAGRGSDATNSMACKPDRMELHRGCEMAATDERQNERRCRVVDGSGARPGPAPLQRRRPASKASGQSTPSPCQLAESPTANRFSPARQGARPHRQGSIGRVRTGNSPRTSLKGTAGLLAADGSWHRQGQSPRSPPSSTRHKRWPSSSSRCRRWNECPPGPPGSRPRRPGLGEHRAQRAVDRPLCDGMHARRDEEGLHPGQRVELPEPDVAVPAGDDQRRRRPSRAGSERRCRPAPTGGGQPDPRSASRAATPPGPRCRP